MSMQAGASFVLPAVGEEVIRTLYLLSGPGIAIGDESIEAPHALQLVPGVELTVNSVGRRQRAHAPSRSAPSESPWLSTDPSS